ncbi:MAG: 4Fe-4S dicluster domain-containing protein [Syntrophorhabdaceae bacterium]|nr:4Fe-4S dicluster domain-containing protein [Syntrophorhabdaceae bacterium]
MTTRITKEKTTGNLLETVQERADVNLSACYQCRKCSIGCPVAGEVESPPAEIIRRLQLGAGDELLQTGLIWTCLSCETCYARCPNQINFAAVIDALKSIAVEKGVARPKGDAPLFNRSFLNTVRSYGRAYDLKAIAMYKLGTGNLGQDMDKFPAMLKKGKMAILPPSGADKDKVKAVFEKAAKHKGAGR